MITTDISYNVGAVKLLYKILRDRPATNREIKRHANALEAGETVDNVSRNIQQELTLPGATLPPAEFTRIVEQNYYFFARYLVEKSLLAPANSAKDAGPPVENIVQFWDSDIIPPDVALLMRGWAASVPDGKYSLFNDVSARDFISENFGAVFLAAYDYCFHPAMKADYFRLCFLYINGGAYVDADEKILLGLPRSGFSDTAFLIVNPIIRQRRGERIYGINALDFNTDPGAYDDCECYFANSPIICSKGNPAVGVSLLRATQLIVAARESGAKCDIHYTTGPTNFTISILSFMLSSGFDACTFRTSAIDWSKHAAAQPLEYKRDERHWEIYEKMRG